MYECGDFTCILDWMVTDLGLNNTDEIIVYAIIFSQSQDGYNYFKGSYRYLSSWIIGSEKRVEEILVKLQSMCLIQGKTVVENGLKIAEFKASLD